MLLTFKVGAAITATAAASFVAGATLSPSSLSPRDELRSVLASQVQRAGKADRVDADQRIAGRRMACLTQDWIRLSPDCAELFTRAAQDPSEVRTTTILVRESPGNTVAIRIPRPESEMTFR